MQRVLPIVHSSKNLVLWISMVSVPFIIWTQENNKVREPSQWALRSSVVKQVRLTYSMPDIAPSLVQNKTTIVKSKFYDLRDPKAERLFKPIILKAAHTYKVDPDLVKAIIMAESRFNPRAISKKGARGLMQLMPRTAKELGVKRIHDPQQNINAGVKYFRWLLNRLDGDVELALAAYNAGYGKVRLYNGVPPYKDTRHYIEKVFEYYTCYKLEMLTERPTRFDIPAE